MVDPKYREGYAPEYTRTGSTTGGQAFVWESFDDMPVGTWIPKIRVTVEGDEKWEANFWSLDIVEEPEDCEINLYNIFFGTNDTHATVAYDLDCGMGSQPGGYNVSIQFAVVENGTIDPLLKYQTTVHYISGYIEDIHTLELTDFTESGMTTYDFYWLAIWGDDDPSFIERVWHNIALSTRMTIPNRNPARTSPSPRNPWFSRHTVAIWPSPGTSPTTVPNQRLHVEVEIFITLYQNGTYYNVSEYHQNPTFMVFNNHDGNQTMFMGSAEIALFDDLPPGEYEILAKYRIKDTSEASSDHFANKVTIGH